MHHDAERCVETGRRKMEKKPWRDLASSGTEAMMCVCGQLTRTKRRPNTLIPYPCPVIQNHSIVEGLLIIVEACLLGLLKEIMSE